VNFGVGGWEVEGPNLRRHLERLCREHAVPVERLRNLRGHRLPTRRPGAPLAAERAMLVGDAAGLVDPWTGDGMFEAFASARHAADAVADVLHGRQTSLAPYEAALGRHLDRGTALAWDVKTLFERVPNLFFAVARTGPGWRLVERFIRRHRDGSERLSLRGRAAVAGLTAVSRALDSPGYGFWRARAG
jgi:flavin-dependent dehydrogenase